MSKEIDLLALMLERARQQTLFYLEPLRGKDLHFSPQVEGITLNSAFWVMAHLTVSENWLVNHGTGGEMIRFSWAKLYNLGTTAPSKDLAPDWEEVKARSKEVHTAAVAQVRSLSEADLELPHHARLTIGGMVNYRDAIIHAVRHECLHTGHLSWLCKLHGVKTV